MNRRGVDADFVLKFVLSAIGLAIIVYVVGTVVSRVVYDGDTAAARQTLSSLMAKADALKDGEKNIFIVRGVEGWYLVGWNLVDGDSRPQKCTLNNCVCICKSPTKDGCDNNNGICMAVKDRQVSVKTEPFTLTQDFSQSQDQISDKKTTDYTPKCIILPENFLDISISKSKEYLEFSFIDQKVKIEENRYLKYVNVEGCNDRSMRG